MSEQWIELMEPDAVAPTLAQRPLRVIALDHRVEVRATEKCQHGQVGLAVPAVGRRVDQYRTARRPHHVSAPEIAVQPRGWIVVIEFAGLAARHHCVNE